MDTSLLVKEETTPVRKTREHQQRSPHQVLEADQQESPCVQEIRKRIRGCVRHWDYEYYLKKANLGVEEGTLVITVDNAFSRSQIEQPLVYSALFEAFPEYRLEVCVKGSRKPACGKQQPPVTGEERALPRTPVQGELSESWSDRIAQKVQPVYEPSKAKETPSSFSQEENHDLPIRDLLNQKSDEKQQHHPVNQAMEENQQEESSSLQEIRKRIKGCVRHWDYEYYLKKADLKVEEGTLVITVDNAFYRSQIEQPLVYSSLFEAFPEYRLEVRRGTRQPACEKQQSAVTGELPQPQEESSRVEACGSLEAETKDSALKEVLRVEAPVSLASIPQEQEHVSPTRPLQDGREERILPGIPVHGEQREDWPGIISQKAQPVYESPKIQKTRRSLPQQENQDAHIRDLLNLLESIHLDPEKEKQRMKGGFLTGNQGRGNKERARKHQGSCRPRFLDREDCTKPPLSPPGMITGNSPVFAWNPLRLKAVASDFCQRWWRGSANRDSIDPLKQAFQTAPPEAILSAKIGEAEQGNRLSSPLR